ncbi:MAG: hypothetical protein LBS83_01440 [Holosporales bacterium]|jgi:hypothetical protein|nr:hypothetical protein [Holosporales bacterium]
MKKILLFTMVSLAALACSNANINEGGIAYTSEVLKSAKKIPVTFADALVALKCGFIKDLRMENLNIKYAVPKTNTNFSPIHAGNTVKNNDNVAKLAIALFPSNGGTINIYTSGDNNVAKIISSFKEKDKELPYKIIASLLKMCGELREIKSNKGRKETENNIIKKAIDLLEKSSSLQGSMKNLRRIFVLVKDSIVFERDIKLYPDYTTEILILSWCCNYFNNNDIFPLLEVFKQYGLIEPSINLSEKESKESKERFLQECERKVDEGYKPENIETLKSPKAQELLSSEEYMGYIAGKGTLVPFGSYLEQNTLNGEIINDKTYAPDCVETAIRHIVTIFCKYDKIQEIIEPETTWNQNLIKFYKGDAEPNSATFPKRKNNLQLNGGDKDTHIEWFDLCRQIPDREGEPDLKSTWENVIRLTPLHKNISYKSLFTRGIFF